MIQEASQQFCVRITILRSLYVRREYRADGRGWCIATPSLPQLHRAFNPLLAFCWYVLCTLFIYADNFY